MSSSFASATSHQSSAKMRPLLRMLNIGFRFVDVFQIVLESRHLPRDCTMSPHTVMDFGELCQLEKIVNSSFGSYPEIRHLGSQ